MSESMPIMDRENYSPCPSHVPFSLLCERQAQINHQQSLARLKDRGGLSPKECLALVDQLEFNEVSSMFSHQAARILCKRVLERAERGQLQSRCAELEEKYADMECTLTDALGKLADDMGADLDGDDDPADIMARFVDTVRDEFKDIQSENAQQKERIAELRNKYDELIMEVCTKHPGETRHETARRYIRQAETPSNNAENGGVAQ